MHRARARKNRSEAGEVFSLNPRPTNTPAPSSDELLELPAPVGDASDAAAPLAAEPRTRATGGSQGRFARPVLVIGLVSQASPNGTWAWDLLQRVGTQLHELIDLTDPGIPYPEFRRIATRAYRLAEAVPRRRRAILVTAIEPGEPQTELTHWHCGGERVRAIAQQHPAGVAARRPEVDPFWLLDELDAGGLDLIRVPPRPIGTARFVRARRRVIASRLLGLVWEIVRAASPGAVLPRDRAA